MAKLLRLVSVLVVLAVVEFTPVGTSSYWDFYCTGGNFTAGSPYSSSVDAVTAVLPRSAASSPLLFSRLNSSHGGDANATVFAVAQCQGDSRSSACETCVAMAIKEAGLVCSFREGAFVFLDTCTVGYSKNKEDMDIIPDNPTHIVETRSEQTDVTVHGEAFEAALGQLGGAVAQRAVTSPRFFATGEKKVNTADYRLNIYALAQCSPDLEPEECDMCLSRLLVAVSISDEQPAERAATLWCSYRYGLHRFFSSGPTLSLPADAFGGGDARPKHKKQRVLLWALIGVSLATVLLIIAILAIGLYFLKKRLSSQKRLSEVALNERRDEETARQVVDSAQALPSALDSFQQIVKLASFKQIALFLDYDGTLSPIVNNPDRAFISEEMHRALRNVARYFRTSIVSGRARSKVSHFVGIEDINYAGSHGMDIKLSTATASSSSEIVEDSGSYLPAEEYLAAITEVFHTLSRATQEIQGANVENNTYCVSVHYRNAAKEDHIRVREVVEEVLKREGADLKLTQGHMVYEVRPPIPWNKGDAVLYLLKHLGLGDSTKVFPIYIGDDKTDEDAFEALRRETTGVGILVTETPRETYALYSLKDPSQVLEFLNLLVKMKTGE